MLFVLAWLLWLYSTSNRSNKSSNKHDNNKSKKEDEEGEAEALITPVECNATENGLDDSFWSPSLPSRYNDVKIKIYDDDNGEIFNTRYSNEINLTRSIGSSFSSDNSLPIDHNINRTAVTSTENIIQECLLESSESALSRNLSTECLFIDHHHQHHVINHSHSNEVTHDPDDKSTELVDKEEDVIKIVNVRNFDSSPSDNCFFGDDVATKFAEHSQYISNDVVESSVNLQNLVYELNQNNKEVNNKQQEDETIIHVTNAGNIQGASPDQLHKDKEANTKQQEDEAIILVTNADNLYGAPSEQHNKDKEISNKQLEDEAFILATNADNLHYAPPDQHHKYKEFMNKKHEYEAIIDIANTDSLHGAPPEQHNKDKEVNNKQQEDETAFPITNVDNLHGAPLEQQHKVKEVSNKQQEEEAITHIIHADNLHGAPSDQQHEEIIEKNFSKHDKEVVENNQYLPDDVVESAVNLQCLVNEIKEGDSVSHKVPFDQHEDKIIQQSSDKKINNTSSFKQDEISSQEKALFTQQEKNTLQIVHTLQQDPINTNLNDYIIIKEDTNVEKDDTFNQQESNVRLDDTNIPQQEIDIDHQTCTDLQREHDTSQFNASLSELDPTIDIQDVKVALTENEIKSSPSETEEAWLDDNLEDDMRYRTPNGADVTINATPTSRIHSIVVGGNAKKNVTKKNPQKAAIKFSMNNNDSNENDYNPPSMNGGIDPNEIVEEIMMQSEVFEQEYAPPIFEKLENNLDSYEADNKSNHVKPEKKSSALYEKLLSVEKEQRSMNEPLGNNLTLSRSVSSPPSPLKKPSKSQLDELPGKLRTPSFNKKPVKQLEKPDAEITDFMTIMQRRKRHVDTMDNAGRLLSQIANRDEKLYGGKKISKHWRVVKNAVRKKEYLKFKDKPINRKLSETK